MNNLKEMEEPDKSFIEKVLDFKFVKFEERETEFLGYDSETSDENPTSSTEQPRSDHLSQHQQSLKDPPTGSSVEQTDEAIEVRSSPAQKSYSEHGQGQRQAHAPDDPQTPQSPMQTMQDEQPVDPSSVSGGSPKDFVGFNDRLEEKAEMANVQIMLEKIKELPMATLLKYSGADFILKYSGARKRWETEISQLHDSLVRAHDGDKTKVRRLVSKSKKKRGKIRSEIEGLLKKVPETNRNFIDTGYWFHTIG